MFGIIIFGLVLFIVAVGATVLHDHIKKEAEKNRTARQEDRQRREQKAAEAATKLRATRPRPSAPSQGGSLTDLFESLGLNADGSPKQEPKNVSADDIKAMINQVKRAKIVRKPGVKPLRPSGPGTPRR